MIIDFNKIEEAVIPNFKGGEKEVAARMFFDGAVRILKAKLAPGSSIGLHTHEDSCEVIIIRSGEGKVLYDGEELRVKAGDLHYCPKGHSHTLINDSNAMLEITGIVPQQ